MSDKKMLVAVHIPKTGGMSFRSLLSQEFGDRLLLDYADRPLASGTFVRNLRGAMDSFRTSGTVGNYDCVYGHFMPIKYRGVENASFAIWFRDPVQRAVSRYFHYRRFSLQQGFAAKLPPDLTLEEFCRIPRFHNTYAKYLWGFPLRRFSFVGITEKYDDSVEVFRSKFAIAAPAPSERVNFNPEREMEGYEISPMLRREIAGYNRKDLVIYARALDQFRHQLDQLRTCNGYSEERSLCS